MRTPPRRYPRIQFRTEFSALSLLPKGIDQAKTFRPWTGRKLIGMGRTESYSGTCGITSCKVTGEAC
jgi:hypothetical protein